MLKQKEPEYSNHHIIGQSERTDFNVWLSENIIRIKHKIHKAIHTLFGFKNTPKEQLWQLREMYDWVLSDTAKRIYDELIKMSEEDFYKPELIKKRKRQK